jgi:hypothetical protein
MHCWASHGCVWSPKRRCRRARFHLGGVDLFQVFELFDEYLRVNLRAHDVQVVFGCFGSTEREIIVLRM